MKLFSTLFLTLTFSASSTSIFAEPNYENISMSAGCSTGCSVGCSPFNIGCSTGCAMDCDDACNAFDLGCHQACTTEIDTECPTFDINGCLVSCCKSSKNPQERFVASLLAHDETGIQEALKAGANPHDLGTFDAIVWAHMDKEVKASNKTGNILLALASYGGLSFYYNLFKTACMAGKIAKIGYETGLSKPLFYGTLSLCNKALTTAFFAAGTAYIAVQANKLLHGSEYSKTYTLLLNARKQFDTYKK